MKKIPDEILTIIKGLLENTLKEYNYLLLDNYYLSDQHSFIQMTVMHQQSNDTLYEKLSVNNARIILRYIPLIHLYRIEKQETFFRYILPNAIVLKDKDRFLVNLKTSFDHYYTRYNMIINREQLDILRWELTNLLDDLNVADSYYVRAMLTNKLVALHNLSGKEYILTEMIPYLLGNQLTDVQSLDKNAVETLVIDRLAPYGGLLKYFDKQFIPSGSKVAITLKTGNYDLDTFLRKIFINLNSLVKGNARYINSFYWEKIDQNNYTIMVSFLSEAFRETILPELRLKFTNNFRVNVGKQQQVTVYDMLDDELSPILNEIAAYLVNITFNEDEVLNENLAITYALECYIAYFILSGNTRDAFFAFNKRISQKWHVLALKDEEILSDYYSTSKAIYKNFEELFQVNKQVVDINYNSKVTSWTIQESIFTDIILSLQTVASKTTTHPVLQTIHPGNPEQALAEAFLFKYLGMLGLSLEKKLYITYIINQLSNDY